MKHMLRCRGVFRSTAVRGALHALMACCWTPLLVLLPGCSGEFAVPGTTGAPASRSPSYEMVRAEIVGRYALLQGFRASVEIYQAPPCDCREQPLFREQGVLDVARTDAGAKYRFSGMRIESAYLKDASSSEGAVREEMRAQVETLLLFDGQTLYQESRVHDDASAASPENESPSPQVIRGTPENLPVFPLPKGWSEQPFDQFEKQGWRLSVQPETTWAGRPAYLLEGAFAGIPAPALASRMRLYFDKESGVLLRLEQYPEGGEPVGAFTLSNFEWNPAFPADHFQYQIPPKALVSDASASSPGPPAAASATTQDEPLALPSTTDPAPIPMDASSVLSEMRARWEKIGSVQAAIQVYDDPICKCQVRTVKEGSGAFLFARLESRIAFRMDVVLRNTGYLREPGSPPDHPVFRSTPSEVYGSRMTYLFDGQDAYQQMGRISETPAAPSDLGEGAPALFEEPRDVSATRGTLKSVNWFCLPLFATIPLLGEAEQSGTLRIAPDETVDGRDTWVLETPPAAHSGSDESRYRRYWIDKETGVPVKCAEYSAPDALRNGYTLTKLVVNSPVDGDDLTFRPPAGVAVSEMDSPPAPPDGAVPPPGPTPHSETPFEPPSAKALEMPDDVTQLLASVTPQWSAIRSLSCDVKSIPQGDGPFAKIFPEASGRFVCQNGPGARAFRLELSGVAAVAPGGEGASVPERNKISLLAIANDGRGHVQTSTRPESGGGSGETTVRRIPAEKLLGVLPVSGQTLVGMLRAQAEIVMTVMAPPPPGVTFPDETPSLYISIEPTKCTGTPFPFVRSWTIGIVPQTGLPAFAVAKAEGGIVVGYLVFDNYALDVPVNATEFEYKAPAGAKMTDETGVQP